MKRVLLRPLALGVVALGLFSLSACSSDNRSGGTISRSKDTGVNNGNADASVTDSGNNNSNPDSGSTTCNNPNCVEHQLMGPAPDCTCLDACTSGYTYNASSHQCDLNSTRPDGGTTTHPDASTNPGEDAGQQGMNCQSAADCQAAGGNACVTLNSDQTALVSCSGQSDCECAISCDSTMPGENCPQGARCSTAGSASNLPGQGICAPANNGNTQGQACQVQFDSMGNPTSDNCEIGYYCWGASQDNPTGICAQFCNPQNGSDAGCSALGNFACNDLGQSGADIGLCMDPNPMYSDIGASCTANNGCQSNYCFTDAQMCTSDCSALTLCPNGAGCVGLQGGGAICVKECAGGTSGDNACRGVNSALVCENLSSDPQNPYNVCVPGCTSNDQCQGGTCNNGHCQ